MSGHGARHGQQHRGRQHLHRFWLFLIQTRVAAAAIVIMGAKLNQQAVIATDDLPRVYRGKSRSHRVVGVARAGYSKLIRNRHLGERFRMHANLRHLPCGCQGNNAQKMEQRVFCENYIFNGAAESAKTPRFPRFSPLEREVTPSLLTRCTSHRRSGCIVELESQWTARGVSGPGYYNHSGKAPPAQNAGTVG